MSEMRVNIAFNFEESFETSLGMVYVKMNYSPDISQYEVEFRNEHSQFKIFLYSELEFKLLLTTLATFFTESVSKFKNHDIYRQFVTKIDEASTSAKNDKVQVLDVPSGVHIPLSLARRLGARISVKAESEMEGVARIERMLTNLRTEDKDRTP